MISINVSSTIIIRNYTRGGLAPGGDAVQVHVVPQREPGEPAYFPSTLAEI